MGKPTAIVTGCTGQDGSYLMELLLEKDYHVIGMKRRSSRNDLGCSAHLTNDVTVEEGDVTDLSSMSKLVRLYKPDEFYNLAAQSHVHTSFDQPNYTAHATGLGVLNCLEAIRLSGCHTRFLQASTSEMYGGVDPGFDGLTETSSFNPRSPYACAKMYGYWMVRCYRDAYKMFAVNSISFNHESKRRGPNFVTRKITLGVAKVLEDQDFKLQLGNMEAQRDWGHAKDYVRGMWMMLQHPRPEDFVLCTGKCRTVLEFATVAFEAVGLDQRNHVQIDPMLYRPADVDILKGDSSKAQGVLGWYPQITFAELVTEMVESDTGRTISERVDSQ